MKTEREYAKIFVVLALEIGIVGDIYSFLVIV